MIRNCEVVYFYLESGVDLSSVAELARLAVYSLFVAAKDYLQREGIRPRIYTVWDEAQVLITQNIEPLLIQARSAGMGCILSHQHLNQLNPPGGVDLRETVLGNTAVKQVFAANEPWLMEYIQKTSGLATPSSGERTCRSPDHGPGYPRREPRPQRQLHLDHPQ